MRFGIFHRHTPVDPGGHLMVIFDATWKSMNESNKVAVLANIRQDEWISNFCDTPKDPAHHLITLMRWLQHLFRMASFVFVDSILLTFFIIIGNSSHLKSQTTD